MEKKNICPGWFLHCNQTQSECRQINNILKCNKGKVAVTDNYCVTYNETESLMEIGFCVYNQEYWNTALTLLEIQHSMMCNKYNRTGTLCGKCKDGHYPLAYSYDMNCVECPDGKSNWWKFVLAVFLPLTVFYFIILFFNINITSSHLHGFVYYSQIVSTPSALRIMELTITTFNNEIQTLLRFIGMFYTPWNLDLLRPLRFKICLGMDTLQTLALDLVVGIYPFVLMILTYLLIDLYDRNFTPLVFIWKPFRALFRLLHRNLEIKTSLIDAFATFFLLTNIKFLSVSSDLLLPAVVYQINSTGYYVNRSLRLYYDATIQYFGETHLPYAIMAIAVLLLFVLLPTLLLILYPFHWFQKCLNLFPVHWFIFHTFIDSFQGCYKDGTQPGTRDCRWFASVFFLSRLFVMVNAALVQGSFNLLYLAMGLILMVIIMYIIQPFKTNLNQLVDVNAHFLLLIALEATGLFAVEISPIGYHTKVHMFFTVASFVFVVLPLLYISAITVHWIYRHRKFGLQLIRRLLAWRHGYEIL